MTARATSTFLQYNRLGRDHPWLGAIIERIDARLRAREGVYEYSASPDCIFRIQVTDSREAIKLSDGTQLRPGDQIINLHLWNEQLPIVPKNGATLSWARRMSQAVQSSLRELALYLIARPDLTSVVALRANMSFGSAEQSEQITRIAARYGFEAAGPAEPATMAGRLHRYGENVLISLMVIARNTAAFRFQSLRRNRTPVYMSRRKLESRFRSTDGDRPQGRRDPNSTGQVQS
jgi:YkoP domain